MVLLEVWGESEVVLDWLSARRLVLLNPLGEVLSGKWSNASNCSITEQFYVNSWFYFNVSYF